MQQPQRHYVRIYSSSTTISEGGVCENTSMCYGTHEGFLHLALLAALKGNRPTSERLKVELPQ
jgi:hypothetical protein